MVGRDLLTDHTLSQTLSVKGHWKNFSLIWWATDLGGWGKSNAQLETSHLCFIRRCYQGATHPIPPHNGISNHDLARLYCTRRRPWLHTLFWILNSQNVTLVWSTREVLEAVETRISVWIKRVSPLSTRQWNQAHTKERQSHYHLW